MMMVIETMNIMTMEIMTMTMTSGLFPILPPPPCCCLCGGIDNNDEENGPVILITFCSEIRSRSEYNWSQRGFNY